MRITVVGSGYVGLVASVCFAELGHDVVVVDNDPIKYSALVRGECPIHEEYVPELLKRHTGSRLNFSNTVADAVQGSKAVFIAVGTPPTHDGEADLSYVESVARDIALSVKDYTVVVGKSTVPVFTSDRVRSVMLLNGAGVDSFDVASNPEFLREGTAVTDFLYADRVVLGANSTQATEVLQKIYQPLLDGSYYLNPDAIPAPNGSNFPPQLISTTTQAAELIKYACNAFLAMKISFINAVATICDSVGADVEQIRAGIGTDSRIGPKFLSPGIGYGGSCFPKDLSAYRAVARECGYDFRLLEEVMRINTEQRQRFLRKVRSALWTIRGKRLGVLGLAFKGGTDDIRESPAISIVQSLVAEGAVVQAYDPAATENARGILPEAVQYFDTAYGAAQGADALLILTEWNEFKALDFARIRQMLRYPIVIDGRNLFSPADMCARGFTYLSIGRPEVGGKDKETKAGFQPTTGVAG